MLFYVSARLKFAAIVEQGGNKPACQSPCSPKAPICENVRWPVDAKIYTGDADDERDTVSCVCAAGFAQVTLRA